MVLEVARDRGCGGAGVGKARVFVIAITAEIRRRTEILGGGDWKNLGSGLLLSPMSEEPVNTRATDGPAMRVLTDQQREFVLYYAEGRRSATEAARKAGFAAPKQYSWHLLRNDRVVAAIREETQKFLVRSSPLGARALIEIASKEDHKDRLKASRELLAHAGLAPATEQKITVEHTVLSAEAVRQEIRRLMGRIPEAPKLLEAAGLVIDAEFTEEPS